MADQDEDDGLYYSIEIDWCRCPLLESIPGKVSGAWVIEGTRMPAQTVIDNYASCMDTLEIAAAWDLDRAAVEAIVAFAEGYRAEARDRILASPEFAALLDCAPAPPPVDWSGCAVVEWMGGPMHDTWVLRGTPTPAWLLMQHCDDGMPVEDIAGHYGWDVALIETLIAYGEAYRAGVGEGSRTPA
jgi:uncharacterized protein (DUF433 family)